MKIISIVGARPQFIKLAPLAAGLKRYKSHFNHLVIHTGQHYDYNMSKIFFDELRIPKPDYHLGVGSATHAQQTGEMLKKIEGVLIKEKPGMVLVFGDTNSTLAGALAAAKLNIPLAHVEAGLRSFNRFMPEEINRLVTDKLSAILFCPTQTAVNNLKKEGITKGVYLVGDVMYDALLLCLRAAQRKSQIIQNLNLKPKSYFLATIHRAENTDNKNNLTNITKAFNKISKNKTIIWPIHPRIADLANDFDTNSRVRIIKPVSYFDMLVLEKNAYKILTDSGGVQKEAYWLKVPCVTLREETEWLETVELGFNSLAGTGVDKVVGAALKDNSKKIITRHHLGPAKSVDRIIKILKSYS